MEDLMKVRKGARDIVHSTSLKQELI